VAPSGISLNEVLVNEEFASLFEKSPLNQTLTLQKNIAVSEEGANDE
jgi:hypothetical protein